eukprot:3250558-Karenia_brevis.AAC.1
MQPPKIIQGIVQQIELDRRGLQLAVLHARAETNYIADVNTVRDKACQNKDSAPPKMSTKGEPVAFPMIKNCEYAFETLVRWQPCVADELKALRLQRSVRLANDTEGDSGAHVVRFINFTNSKF